MATAAEIIKLQLKRGNSSFDVTRCTNVVLSFGEPLFDGTSQKLYIGDGVTALSNLRPLNLAADAETIINVLNGYEGTQKINSSKVANSNYTEYISRYASGLPDTNNKLDYTTIFNKLVKVPDTVDNTGSGNVVTSVSITEGSTIANPAKITTHKTITAIDINQVGYLDGNSSYDIGGITTSDDLGSMTLVQIITKLLQGSTPPAPTPISNLTFTLGTTETATDITVNSITPSFTSGTSSITSFMVGLTPGGNELLNATTAVSGTTYNLTTPHTGTNYTVYATLQDSIGTVLTASRNVIKVIADVSYWGVVPTTVTSENITVTDVTGLANQGDLSSWGTSGGTTTLQFGDCVQNYVVFAYPKSYGTITDAYVDSPVFPERNSFNVVTTIAINGVPYYVYIDDNTAELFGTDIQFNFTKNPSSVELTYWGLIDYSITHETLTEADIVMLDYFEDKLSTWGTDHGTVALDFGTAESQRIVVAYPQSYGELTQAYIDSPAMPELSSFTEMTAITVKNVPYYVYIEDLNGYPIIGETDFHFVI